jgi:protocatechuate 3,4-dioxygenase beta subunit
VTPGLDAGQTAQQDAGSALADASTDATAGDAAVIGGGWASGGTKSMQGGYPDPFSGAAPGSACMLFPAQTLGPCYAQRPAAREDISDGLPGLPMRLSFLVVRQDGCTPVPNASVDIWHSGSQGIYSAFRTGTTCNPGTMDVLSQTFCRGVQTASGNGRVDFNTVFPGWYRGRTLHIHFTVRVDGREYTTSQLYWEDALVDEILAQGEYKARGKRDTLNTGDSIFRSGGATPQQVLFSTAKRADGVLHAWKVLSIRNA